MINAIEALKIVLGHTHLIGTERVALLEALGRTLGQDIVAEEDLPPFNNSSMDGFAVASSHLRHATSKHPRVMRIAGESSAGNVFPGEVVGGQAIRVMTGAMMPQGTNTVVPIEHATELDNHRVQFTGQVKRGQHVRVVGEDIRWGDVVLRKGQTVTPGALGVLAALGFTRVTVFKQPRVNILATGDELVDIESDPGEGQVRNSSSYALAAFVLNAGGKTNLLGIASDVMKDLRKKLKSGLHDADLLLVTGGVSVGRYDFVKDVLSELGVEIEFWKVRIKPGKPIVFGKRKETLVFGLPGNPVSTAVTFLQFVRPALLKMSGRSIVQAARHSAVLDQGFSKSDTLRHFLRGIAVQRNGELRVSTTGSQSSGVMSSMSKANCLIIIPEETRTIRKGGHVDIEFL